MKPMCIAKPPLALLVVLEVVEEVVEGGTPVLVTTRVLETLVVPVEEDRPEDVDPIVN